MDATSFASLYRRFLGESQLTLLGFQASLKQTHTPVCQLAREMCAIRLYDAWMRTCEQLVVASACDAPVTLGGHVVTRCSTTKRRGDVLPSLRATYRGASGKPPWWEPHWGDPTELLDAAQRLRLHNYSTLSLGMSITPNPTAYLRSVRNFFAHRNQGTAAKIAQVIQVYAPGQKMAIHQLLGSPVPGGTSVFESWVHELRTMLRTSVS
jgi:hypothetical protein